MTDPALEIQKALDRRDAALSKRERDQKKHEDKLLKKVTQATVVHLPALWWLPAFLRSKVKLQKKNAELERSMLQYQEHSSRQAADLKYLFTLALKYFPQDEAGWKDMQERLDPQYIYRRKV